MRPKFPTRGPCSPFRWNLGTVSNGPISPADASGVWKPFSRAWAGSRKPFQDTVAAIPKTPPTNRGNTGKTGHAEAVEVIYDSEVVGFSQLVNVYFGSQNVTQVNGQGPDRGSQYRSIVFYQNEEEKKIIQEKIAALNEKTVVEKGSGRGIPLPQILGGRGLSPGFRKEQSQPSLHPGRFHSALETVPSQISRTVERSRGKGVMEWWNDGFFTIGGGLSPDWGEAVSWDRGVKPLLRFLCVLRGLGESQFPSPSLTLCLCASVPFSLLIGAPQRAFQVPEIVGILGMASRSFRV